MLIPEYIVVYIVSPRGQFAKSTILLPHLSVSVTHMYDTMQAFLPPAYIIVYIGWHEPREHSGL